MAPKHPRSGSGALKPQWKDLKQRTRELLIYSGLRPDQRQFTSEARLSRGGSASLLVEGALSPNNCMEVEIWRRKRQVG